ncbi:MAG TPA: hypothetical protein VNN21_02210 [Dehalococcoidia bacterium]|nr:hypothetical protein [Dehalococcoidia bacterium]
MADNVFEGYQSGHVNVERSAVRSLNATTANVGQSAVQRLTAEAVTAESSAFGMVNASTAELKQSGAAVVAGDYVKVEESRVFFLVAPRVSGNVNAVLTLPAAFAFGAGFFLARRLLLAVAGRKR